MKRKKLLAFVVMAFLLVVISSQIFSSGKAEAKEVEDAKEAVASKAPLQLRLAHVVPPTSTKDMMCEYFAKLVKERTNGEIDIQVYPASQLGNELQIAQAVEMGSIDLGWIDAGIYDSFVPEVAVFNAPLLFRNSAHWEAVAWGPIMDEMADKLLKKTGVRIVGRMWMGERYILTVKKPVKTPVELRGLKIRVPQMSMYAAGFKALGATPTPIPYADVYMALQQGVVDGMENPSGLIRSMKFYEVCKYMTLVPVVNAVAIMAMNDGVFQKLTKKQQEVILQAGNEAHEYLKDLMTNEEEDNLKFFESQGVTMVKPNNMEAWLKQLEAFPKENANLWGGDVNLFYKIHNYQY